MRQPPPALIEWAIVVFFAAMASCLAFAIIYTVTHDHLHCPCCS